MFIIRINLVVMNRSLKKLVRPIPSFLIKKSALNMMRSVHLVLGPVVFKAERVLTHPVFPPTWADLIFPVSVMWALILVTWEIFFRVSLVVGVLGADEILL